MIEQYFTPDRIAAAILTIIGAYGFVRLFFRRKLKTGETVNWSPLESISIVILAFFGVSSVAVIWLMVFIWAIGLNVEQSLENLETTPWLMFAYVLANGVLTLGLLHLFFKKRKTSWASIGWIKPRLTDIGYTMLGFVTYFAIYAFIVFNLVESLFPQVDTEQPQQLGFDTTTTGPELIFVFLSLVILPPLVEEILVRGFLFTGLKQKMHVFAAAIVTSLVFAAAHLQWGSGAPLLWAAAADTFTLSMVLVWLRHKTGSLWPGIGVHFVKNGIAFLALFIFNKGA